MSKNIFGANFKPIFLLRRGVSTERPPVRGRGRLGVAAAELLLVASQVRVRGEQEQLRVERPHRAGRERASGGWMQKLQIHSYHDDTKPVLLLTGSEEHIPTAH